MADPDWATVISGGITGLAALAGVAVAQRAAQERDLRQRLDDKRLDAYVDALKWSIDCQVRIDDARSGAGFSLPEPGSHAEMELGKALMPPADLEARIAAFASGIVAARFSLKVLTIRSMAAGRSEPPDDPSSPIDQMLRRDHESYRKSVRSLRDDLDDLGREIREELDITGGASHDRQITNFRRRKHRQDRRMQKRIEREDRRRARPVG